MPIEPVSAVILIPKDIWVFRLADRNAFSSKLYINVEGQPKLDKDTAGQFRSWLIKHRKNQERPAALPAAALLQLHRCS